MFIFSLCFLLFLLAAVISWSRELPVAAGRGNGLFSWQASVLESSEAESLFQLMREMGLSELYQHIPADTGIAQVQDFLHTAQNYGISVYLLTGDPAWGTRSGGESMLEEIQRAAYYNKGLAGKQRLRGIMMDCEPYLTEEWDRNRSSVMKSFVKAMVKARKASEEDSLEYIACIPYFYDNKGQDGQLKKLVGQGCHALAVMNYDKKKEADNLATESKLASEYGKPLIVIYELQAPGTHDLTERNTYYREGPDAVRLSFQALQKNVPSVSSYAIHNYKALKEVLGR